MNNDEDEKYQLPVLRDVYRVIAPLLASGRWDNRRVWCPSFLHWETNSSGGWCWGFRLSFRSPYWADLITFGLVLWNVGALVIRAKQSWHCYANQVLCYTAVAEEVDLLKREDERRKLVPNMRMGSSP
jgi:hypothetical protein